MFNKAAPRGMPGKFRYKTTITQACPVCGAEIVPDRTGWRCTQGGYAHFYQYRYGHLKKWFCSEGAKRHAMFLNNPPRVRQSTTADSSSRFLRKGNNNE